MPTPRPDIQNRATLQPVRAGGFQAANFDAGSIVGAAVARAGETLSRYAQREDELNERYDVAAAKRADNEAMLRVSEIRQSVLATQGLDTPEARRKAEEDLARLREETMSSLANERQRVMFANAFDARTISDRERMATYEVGQVRAAEIGQAQARADQFLTRARENFAVPEEMAAAFATADREIAAAMPGQSADAVALAQKKARSAVLVDIANDLRVGVNGGEGDPFAADEWLTRHASEILPEDEQEARSANAVGLEEGRLDGYMGMVRELAITGRSADVADVPPGVGDEAGASEGPDTSKRERAAVAYSDPLRGVGSQPSGGQRYGAARGTRSHGGADYAAPEGTPVYPPADGVVKGEPYWTDQGGWQVRVQHADGRVTGYAHLRTRPDLSDGQRVSKDEAIASVGNTGVSTGPHLHFTVRDADGNTVDPTKQTWAESDLPLHTPQNQDQAALYRAAHQVAVEQNLSPRMYEALLRRVDADVARSDRLLAREQRDAENALYEQIASLGDNLTRRDQVPGYGQLPGRLKIFVDGIIEQNTAPAEPTAGGGDYWAAYLDVQTAIAEGRPEDIDPSTWGAMTTGERNGLLRKYADGLVDRSTGTGTASGPSISSIFTAVNRYSREGGFSTGQNASDEDRATRGKLVGAVEAEIARRGGTVTDRELDEIVRSQVMQVTVQEPGMLWGTNPRRKPFFEITDGDREAGFTIDVPRAASARIIAEYKDETGVTLDPSNVDDQRTITRIYRRSGGVR